jgi:hypothetical protein
VFPERIDVEFERVMQVAFASIKEPTIGITAARRLGSGFLLFDSW